MSERNFESIELPAQIEFGQTEFTIAFRRSKQCLSARLTDFDEKLTGQWRSTAADPMRKGLALKLSTSRTPWWWPFSQTRPEMSEIKAKISKILFYVEALATAFSVEFGYNNFHPYSTLRKESNTLRITSIGVRTEKLRLIKFSVTKNSAVIFSELCLRFLTSHDIPEGE